jgi:hypothetical protein
VKRMFNGAGARGSRIIGVLAGTVLLLGTPSALAARSSDSQLNVAARKTLWYVRIHNELLGRAFGRDVVPTHIRLTTPAVGVLGFSQPTGPISGRISCVRSTRMPDRTLFGCRWVITIKRHGLYWGLAMVTVYRHGGYDVQSPWSKCRASSHDRGFCRRHPPPRG